MAAKVAPASDDPYAGFEEVHPALDVKQLQMDSNFQEAVKSSYGRRPMTQNRMATGMGRMSSAAPQRTAMGLGTAGGSAGDGLRRPMTSVRGTGYTSQQAQFDPMQQSSKGPAPPLISKADESPEAQLKAGERRIMILVEESCLAAGKGDRRTALEKAKEASSKEKSLIRQREQASLSDGHNLDLTFSVLFNLANQYASNEMYTEALNTYQIITKDRMFSNSGRLRVNMGNIYFKTGNYAKAVKFYRMAYDQVPNTHKSMKIRIMHNIGLVFVKMGQYSEACNSFEYIMQEQPNFLTGLDLVTAYYAIGEKDKMKSGYLKLLECTLDVDDDEKYTSTADDTQGNLILEVIRNDKLRKQERGMKHEAERAILTAAKLISPVIEENFSDGYNWCVNAIKNSSYPELASDLEINKAVMFLRQKNFKDAVETLKMFEKKETKVASTAATNLSFLYILQKDLPQAENYATQARDSNGYNEAALVNLGNVCFLRGDYEKARELYLAALEIDAAAVEALYNLGLTHKQLGRLDDALEILLKLHAIVRSNPPVVAQIAHLYQLKGDTELAAEWYLQVLSLVPTDSHILERLGQIYDSIGDKQQAYQYYYDSFRYFPSNLDVIDWLGSYFIELQYAEKAIDYFERAALMQPDQPKWQLMVAACHRRAGAYHKALNTYKQINIAFPENTECLKMLVRISNDLGLAESSQYAMELKKAERANEQREVRAASSRPGSRRSSSRSTRSGSAISGYEGGNKSPMERAASSRSFGGPRSFPGSAVSGRATRLSLNDLDNNQPYLPSTKEVVDDTYQDPMGPVVERPKTSMRKDNNNDEDDFADEELGELLPE